MHPDRQPPYAPEAEVAVLGGMLLDADAVPVALELLTADDFYRPGHRILFNAMRAVAGRGAVVDPTTLGEHLTDCGELKAAGGYEYIAELLDVVPTAANLPYHADIVRDRSQRRKLIDAGTKIIHLGYESDKLSGANLMDAAEGLVFGCALNTASGAVQLRQAMGATFERLDELQNAPGGITGVSSGFPDLDDMTGGLQRGDLILVAARPSMGKTGFMTGLALHAALQVQTPVAFFSFEMSKDQVVRRMLCHEALVDLLAMNRGRLRDDDFTRIAQVAGPLNTAPLWIEDANANVNSIRATCRRVHREAGGLGLVVIDYLGMIQGEGENRNHEIGFITRNIKGLAKELNVPVVLGAQLNRAADNRSDHRPQLSDLRDSGNIEQDADLVGFLHRPEWYMTPSEAREKGIEGKAEFIIRKQRNGPTGEVELFFRKNCARFEGLASWGVKAA